MRFHCSAMRRKLTARPAALEDRLELHDPGMRRSEVSALHWARVESGRDRGRGGVPSLATVAAALGV